MSFTSDYLELRKKRKNNGEEAAKKATDNGMLYSRLDIAPTPIPMATDTDIAPTVTEVEDERKWFQKGAFEDGYQFGDILKTISGTSRDLSENFFTGIVGLGEKAVDAVGTYIVAPIGGLFDEDFKEDTLEWVKKDLYDEEKVAKAIVAGFDPIGLVRKNVNSEEDSVLGEKADSIVQSGGELAGTIALQAAGVPWWVTTGLTSAGGEVESALRQGATHGEAALSGLITAGAEILTEKISGGIKFGGSTLDDALTKKIATSISDKTVRTLVKLGVDMAGEGGEEVLSGAISAIGQKITYADDKELNELFSKEDAWESFIGGAVLGGVGSGSRAVGGKVTGRDATTGLTANEEAVFKKVYEDRIAEAEKDGELSNKEKNKIYDEVMEDLRKGGISVDTIESVLGGESYKAYKDTVDSEDAILNEYDELGKKENPTLADQSRYAELSEKVKGIKENSQRNALKSKLSEDVQGLLTRDDGKRVQTDDYLIESYNERARRGQAFEVDTSKYDEKQAAVIQNAIDSGILNNTRRTHEFVDMVAKISADKGVLFDFTNNERLKESGFAVDGKTVNGYVTKDGVAINIQAAKSLNSVVGHEIAHVLEGTEIYTELQTALFDYAKSKKDYDGRRQTLENLYKDIKDANVDAELTADLVGDYLFTDEAFVKSLSAKHRNVFQKIYDEIKYLLKVATAGSKEARELERVKRAFDKAYREGGKTAETGEKKFSLGYHAGDLGKAESYAQQGRSRGTGHFGTGTYFVGDEVKISDSTYGKRPHEAVDFDKYNFYTVKSDKDGYDLHEQLKVIDGGVTQAFLDSAKAGDYRVSELHNEAWKLADENQKPDVYDEELGFSVPPSDYTDVVIQAFADVANKNGIEVKTYDEWLAEQSDDVPAQGDSDYEFYKSDYLDYLKKSLDDADEAANDGYQEFNDAYFRLCLRFGQGNVNNALQAVVDYNSSMSAENYQVQSTADSLATVFMKSLGYEGIDVRGTGLDNVAYGSVIYDLKGEDLARKNEIGTAKYSLSDSEGNTLTKEQSEYFKNSKVVDDNGNLLVVYHGSPSKFTVFDHGKMNVHGNAHGRGFYFTENKSLAEGYEREGGQLLKGYLNIEKPLSEEKVTIKKEDLVKLIKATCEEQAKNLVADDEYSSVREALPDTWISNYVMTYGMNINDAYREVANTVYSGADNDVDIIAELTNGGAGNATTLELTHAVLGYDGVIYTHPDGTHEFVSLVSNQFKNIDNANPTANSDIRYSLTEQETKETNDKLKDVGLAYDAKSDTVSYSVSSLEDAFQYDTNAHGIRVQGDDYIKARDEYVNALAKSIAVDKDNPTAEEKMKASKYLDGLFLIHDMIAADKDRLDYEAAVNKSAWVSNAEYGGSIDFSTLCAKRRLFTGTFDAIQNALPDTVLNENDFLKIRDMLLEKELESPCSMCYVEGSRARHGVYVEKWLKEYLKTNPEWRPQIADFTSSTRLEQTRINHPEAYAEYQKAMNKLAQRKPKEASVRTDYKGEILVAFADGSSVEIKNKNGGIRFNSFSDFEIIHALDCMQVITDMARVGLNGQAYTKVKEFAESFGNTGLKINLSLVAKDVDANGKLIMDEVNGMKYAEAMDIRNKYSENVGTVIVVFNDAQLKAALADSTIDYVLPFHRSQWKKSQYTMMGLPTVTKDYTALQNDRITNPKTGKPVKLSGLKMATAYTNDITGETYVIKDNIMPNEYWDYTKSGRDNANRYLDYINANGMTPKFDFLLEKVGGKWVLPEGAVGDGYFKLLIDFKMYNNDGVGSPQRPVLPEFNMPYIQDMLNNYVGGHQSFPVAHDVVDAFVEGKRSGQFSLSFEDEAPKSYGKYNVYGKDVALEKQEAPVQDDIAPVAEAVDEAVTETPEIGLQQTDEEVVVNDTPAKASNLPNYADNEIASYKRAITEERANAKPKKTTFGALKRLVTTKPKGKATNHGVLTVDGKQYMTCNGYFAVEMNNPDKSILENEALVADKIKNLIESASNSTEGNYEIDAVDISLIRKQVPSDNKSMVVVGDDCYDIRFVDAVLKAIENPTLSLSPYRSGSNLLVVNGSNGRAIICPVDYKSSGAKDLRFVYRAEKVGGESILPDDLAPMQETDISTITDKDAPPEAEAPYQEASTSITPSNPFDSRDIDKVGNPKVKAFAEENPEVKPFFKEAANAMLGDLRNTTKGERHPITDAAGYIVGWDGAKRQTTEDIAYLLDNCRYTYAQIENGLNAIINDGKYNAVAKKIEFLLNDRLMQGYTDAFGNEIPSNQDYLDLLSQRQVAEEVNQQNAAEHLVDAPVMDAPIKEAYEAIKPQGKPKQSNEPRMKRVDSEEARRGGEKERSWVETSTESDAVDGIVTPDDIPDDVRYYKVKSNKKTLATANARLEKDGYAKSREYFEGRMSERKLTVEDIALGERLIQEAAKAGDAKAVRDLIIDVSILGTELGQRVQALSIIRRLTPEGQLKALHRIVERGKAKGDKSFDGVEVTEDMTKKILDTKKEDGTFDQAELDKAVEDVKQDIADQMTVSKMDYVNAWRYLSMLGNPKTHLRNIVSNVAMFGTRAVKNAIARTIEGGTNAVANVFGFDAPIKNRARTWRHATDAVKNFATQTTIDMDAAIKGDTKYSEEGSIKAKRKIFKTEAGNWLADKNNAALEWEDALFSKTAFRRTLQEYLTANGIKTEADIKNNPELVEKAKDYALEEARKATFRQDSYLANKISEIEKKNPFLGIAIGSVMPFKKTPINIAKTGVAYSPLGFARNVYDLVQVKKGNMEASEAIDHLAQTLTGTSLALIGFALANAGLLNGAGDDDKEGKYDYQLGEQSYSFNFGGNTYSLSWLSPVAMPLFVGANAYEKLVEKEDWDMNVAVDALAQTLDPLSEMSFLSSLDDVLSSYDSGMAKIWGAGESMIQNYATQFIPTLSSQFAATFDDTKRSTKASRDSGFKFGEETLNQIKYKIPGLRNTLQPTTDIWGKEYKQNENFLARGFESFISPANKRVGIVTDVDKELKALYGETGKSELLPSIPYDYINYKDVKYEMSAKDFTAYKQTYGQTAYEMLEALFDTDTYKNADAETRADLVNDVYDYARDFAKREYLAKYGVDFYNSTEDNEEVYKENPIKGAIENDMMPDEYAFSLEYPEKYEFFKQNGISYRTYKDADEDEKRAYTWAYENPEKLTVSKAIASDFMTYYRYRSELYDIKADKDSAGKSISGSRKEKVIEYINNLDADYGERIILFKSEYNADDTYNYEIIEYLNNREDISYEEMATILKELGFTVTSDGSIYW